MCFDYRFVLTIATMVWALFGLINADDFNAASPLETIVGKVGIALWLMVATISLLIMFSIAVTKIVQVKQVEHNCLTADIAPVDTI